MADPKERVLHLAAIAVQGASRDGGTIAAHIEAARLFDEHPDCPMTRQELCDEIARLATQKGVGVEFGDRS